MKKFLKVVAYILLVLAIGALVVSTYFTSTGINERWNENISQYLGGATIGVCASSLISLVINFASKSNLDLGIKDFSKSASDFMDKAETIKGDVAELNRKYNEELSKMKELIEHYEKTLKTVELSNKKLDIVLSNQVEIAKHDSKMVANGTSKKLIADVNEVKEDEGKN